MKLRGENKFIYLFYLKIRFLKIQYVGNFNRNEK